jgi:hypothetical protein
MKDRRSHSATAQAVGFPTGNQATSHGVWGWLSQRVRSWFEPPFGYQDETGFHYGNPPEPHRNASPLSSRPAIATDRASDVMSYPLPVSDLPADVPTQVSESSSRTKA